MNENAVCQLLVMYEAGEFAPNVRRRLAEIFRHNPPDAWDRLERAAEYLNVTGDDLELWLEIAEKPRHREVA